MSDAAVTFTFAPVDPDEERIKVYLPPDLGDEFVEFMRAEGYETSQMAELAFGVDDIIIAFALVGGLKGLATVLEKYFSRNQHKKLVVKSGEVTYEITGMSTGEMKKSLEGVLDVVDAQQRRLDDSWHAILREMPDSPKHLASEAGDSDDFDASK